MSDDKIEIMALDETNLAGEDVVCVRGEGNKEGINLKKAWLRARFSEGLKFKKLIINGRSWGFIEYLPAEYAWRPVDAPGYMFIDCIWVIGRQKGKGYGKLLLEECLKDACGMNGVCVVASNKPFMAKKDMFLKNGFEVCDTAPPFYELLVKKMKGASLPQFTEKARKACFNDKEGAVFLYSDQCPYTARYLDEMMEGANELGIPVKKLKLTSAAQTREMPFAYGTCGVIYRGKLLTHGILTRKDFVKLLTAAKSQ